MRVSSFQIYNQLTNYINDDLTSLNQTEEQLATGKTINENSDNVIGLMNVMDYNIQLSQNTNYTSNINNANTQLGNAGSAMSSTMSALQSLQELASQGANATDDSQDMDFLAQQAYQIADEILGYANTKTANNTSLFAGFQTQTDAFNSSTYEYQGDSGVANVQISGSQSVAENIPGSTAFSYTLSAPVTVQNSDGTSVTYTPGSGTTVNVQIMDSSGNVTDSCSFSNFMQLAQALGNALNSNDTAMVQALETPLSDALTQAANVQSNIGAMQDTLTAESSTIQNDNLTIQNQLSNVDDTDFAQASTQMDEEQTSLQALLQSSGQIFSESLLDFLSSSGA